MLRRAEKGQSVPAEILNPPVLFDDLVPIYKAFLDLHQQRSFGQMPNPISAGDMQAYFDIHSIPRHWREYYHDLIRAMDRTYLTHVHETKNAGWERTEALGNAEQKRLTDAAHDRS